MIVAFSQGETEVRRVPIVVTEFNKYPPKFEKELYYGELHVNSPVNTSVLLVRAYDEDLLTYNSEIFYWLGKNAPNEIFQIDPRSGQLTFSRQGSQPRRRISFNIVAEDGGSPSRRTQTRVEIVFKIISEPVEVHTRNATDSSVYICWSKPEYGEVAGYIIKYRKVGDEEDGATIFNITTNAISNCIILEGLKLWTEYEFRVYGWNVNETGLGSAVVRFTTRHDYCLLNICQHGNCNMIKEDPGYKCECADGYYGDVCDQFDPCSMNPCDNLGSCRRISNYNYSCECINGFSGQNCTTFNPCAIRPSPCENGASCESNVSHTYTCLCVRGFYGKTCQHFNSCFLNPCHNGGTCHNTSSNDFTCDCNPGYGGEQCEMNINECDSRPCLNGAKCEDGINTFMCSCNLGYHGSLCEIVAQCPPIVETTNRGVFYWNETEHGTFAQFECPYGVLHTGHEGFAQKRCHLLESGLVEWGTTYFRNCREEGFKRAEEITGKLKILTKNPENMNPQKLREATRQIQDIVNYALTDHKVAENMLSVISNMLALNDSVLAEADENGTTTSRLVWLVDRYMSDVKLEKGKSITLETDNIALKALSWDPELSENAEEVLKFSPTHLAPGTSQVSQTKNHIPRNKDYENKTTDSLIFVPVEAVRIAEAELSEVRVKFVAYRNDKFFRSRIPTNERPYQMVLQASISDIRVDNLTDPLVYVMRSPVIGKVFCVFWKEKEKLWATDGISTNKTQNFTICSSTHMTAFSVLLDPTPNTEVSSDHQEALSIISYVGCVVSICGLILTILTYALFRCLNRDRSGKILLNLCVSMLLMNTSFLVGSQRGSGVAGVDICVIVAVLIHYFLLTSLAWMCVEAINMYQMVIHVFASTETRFVLKRCFLAWGCPLLIVGVAVGINFEEYGYKNKLCMLSPANPYVYYISFLGPSCLILLVNIAVFVMVTRVLFTPRMNTKPRVQIDSSSYAVIAAQVRGAFTVMTLLGVTWVFGVLAVGKAKLVFQYVFCIANSLQGFLIFLVRCLQYPEARNGWIQLVKTRTFKKHRGVVPPGGSWHTNSNPARKQSNGHSASDHILSSTSSDTTSTLVYWNPIPNKETPNPTLSRVVNNTNPLEDENSFKNKSQSNPLDNTEVTVNPDRDTNYSPSLEDLPDGDPFASIGFIDEDAPTNGEDGVSGDESGYQSSSSPKSKFPWEYCFAHNFANEVIDSKSENVASSKGTMALRDHCNSFHYHHRIGDDESTSQCTKLCIQDLLHHPDNLDEDLILATTPYKYFNQRKFSSRKTHSYPRYNNPTIKKPEDLVQKLGKSVYALPLKCESTYNLDIRFNESSKTDA
ncbi:adhesion G protein-coupled receptor E1-like isoform X2 [Limulus polyphemus]|nr:adhesion G protein-coupled receptor E1-like isoform X2 [Limulus polyphemus]